MTPWDLIVWMAAFGAGLVPIGLGAGLGLVFIRAARR